MRIHKVPLQALVLAFLALSSSVASASWREGGGGNDLGLEFASYARSALNEFAHTGLPEATSERLTALRAVLARARFVAVEEELPVQVESTNPVIQLSVAMNFPKENLVELSARRWERVKDERVRRAIAFHELEGLAGEEATGDYRISGAYLHRIGYKAPIATALLGSDSAPAETVGDAPRPRVEYQSVTESVVSYAFDTKTKKELNYLNGKSEGILATFRDGAKVFSFTLYTHHASGARALAELSTTEFGERGADGRATARYMQSIFGAYGAKTEIRAMPELEMISERVSPGVFRNFDRKGTELYRYRIESFTGGRSIQTFTQVQPQFVGSMELASFSRLNVLTAIDEEELLRKVPVSVRPRLKAFTAVHASLIALKDEWGGCAEHAASELACAEMKQQIDLLNVKRERLWAGLVTVSDFPLPPPAPRRAIPPARDDRFDGEAGRLAPGCSEGSRLDPATGYCTQVPLSPFPRGCIINSHDGSGCGIIGS